MGGLVLWLLQGSVLGLLGGSWDLETRVISTLLGVIHTLKLGVLLVGSSNFNS